MSESDEQVEDMQVEAQNVYINTGWTPGLAFWNTVGTILGALSGVAALVLSGVALWVGLR